MLVVQKSKYNGPIMWKTVVSVANGWFQNTGWYRSFIVEIIRN
jgi:hypothetical protein